MIGTLAVDGRAYIWYSEEGPGRAAASPSPLLAVPNVTARPSTASVPTSYYSMWPFIVRSEEHTSELKPAYEITR